MEFSRQVFKKRALCTAHLHRRSYIGAMEGNGPPCMHQVPRIVMCKCMYILHTVCSHGCRIVMCKCMHVSTVYSHGCMHSYFIICYSIHILVAYWFQKSFTISRHLRAVYRQLEQSTFELALSGFNILIEKREKQTLDHCRVGSFFISPRKYFPTNTMPRVLLSTLLFPMPPP